MRECRADAHAHCAAQIATVADAEAGKDLSGLVFRCLADTAYAHGLSDACAAEVTRAARTGLSFYTPVSVSVGCTGLLPDAFPC